MSKRSYYRIGVWAEYAARVYLWIKGYRLLKRRYKTPVGEIDLIFLDGCTLVFVEVKRRDTVRGGLEAISVRQWRRISKAGHWFTQEHPHLHHKERRFDAVVVKKYFFIHHFTNTWQEGSLRA